MDKKLEFWRANIKSKSPKPAELLAVYYIVYTEHVDIWTIRERPGSTRLDQVDLVVD